MSSNGPMRSSGTLWQRCVGHPGSSCPPELAVDRFDDIVTDEPQARARACAATSAHDPPSPETTSVLASHVDEAQAAHLTQRPGDHYGLPLVSVSMTPLPRVRRGLMSSTATPLAIGTNTGRWVLGITSAAALLVGLDALVVSTAITTIRSDLAATTDQLGWMVNAYTLTFAVLLMPASALGNRFGRRRVFISGVLLFTVASVACALATDPSALIASRAVQGAGSAAIMPLALALLTAAFPPEQRAGAMGVFAAVTGASVPLGPLVGGVVVHGISWPWIFWINVPLGIALGVAARLKLSESETTRARFDFIGVLLVAVGALGVVWALVRGDRSGWTSPEIVAALTIGLVGLAAFFAWEGRTQTPMLPLTLFRKRPVLRGKRHHLLRLGIRAGVCLLHGAVLSDGAGSRRSVSRCADDRVGIHHDVHPKAGREAHPCTWRSDLHRCRHGLARGGAALVCSGG